MFSIKAQNAVLWSGVDIFLRQVIQFGISIALARLLSPDEFGTIALVLFFTGVANSFIDGGFSSALIQRQDITHTDESTVFWFNLATGILMAVVLLAAAPLIAIFYDRPILEPLIVVMAANVFISALGSIHTTLLTKRLDFRTQMKVGLLATTFSGCVAVTMAMQGYGVWALAYQTLTAALVTCVFLWIFSPWRPTIEFSRNSIRRLIGFGGNIMIAGLLEITFSRVYTLLIGRLYGVRELGLYERADSTMHLPISIFTGIFSRIAFPMFSAVANDRESLRYGVRFAVRLMMLINVPMMLGMAVVAEPMIVVLFGKQWLATAPVLQILCIGGIFWPLHVINLNVLMAQGHSRLFLRLEVAKKLLGIAFLIGGMFYGIVGIAWSQVAFGIMAFFLNAYYTKKHLAYGAISQLRDFFPTLVGSIVMAILVYQASMLWDIADAKGLIFVVILGIFVYVATNFLFKIEAMRDLITIFRTRP